MKILFIAAPFPYPPDTGSRNLIFHWLAAACAKHEVELIVLEEPRSIQHEIPVLPNLKITLLDVSVGRSLPARVSRLAKSVLLRIPATSLVYMPAEIVRSILQRVDSDSYDLAVLTENVVAGFSPLLASRVPTLLFKHSVDAINARDIRKRHGMVHPRWWLEELILKRYEARTSRAASVVCCVNQEDAEELATRYRLPRKPEIVPIGVELKLFPRRMGDPRGKVVGFYGNLEWGANGDAAKWFIEQVLPRVWEKDPHVLFKVIGPGADKLPVSARESRVIRVGPLPQDQIAKALEDTTIGVVPVISGTGIRLKLLEMLSMGMPIVSTSLGILGTNCVSGKHLLVADTPDSFAEAVALLASDVDLRRKLARSAAEIAPTYTWEGVYPRILSVFELAARSVARPENYGATAQTAE